jgi:hypothetical protein
VLPLLIGLALLALPSQAPADVELSAFSVTPSTTQAGGHPDVTIVQQMTYTSGSDDVKDTFVRLAPGLLGNPQNAAVCSEQQFRADSCAADTVVGSVSAVVTLIVDVQVNGTVYNLRPAGQEPARVGLVLRPDIGEKVFLEAPIFLKAGADGYGLESTFADQPRTNGPFDTQIKEVALTFNGKASKGSFMRNPTSCGAAVSVGRVNSWDAPMTFSEKTHSFTPTGCDQLGFAPTADGAVGAPGQTSAGDHPPVTTTLRLNPEEAALNRAEVILPLSLAPNPNGLSRSCSRDDANASNCPESSRVGTAIVDSPLQAEPVRGPVYLALNTPAPLPGLIVILPPPVGVRADAVVETGSFGTKNIFPTNPDLPLRSFTLTFDGGPDSTLVLTKDLCDPKTDTAIQVALTAHSGKRVEFKSQLATPGCDPRAKVSIRRRGRKATLVARLTAAREGPSITAAAVSLPKGLRRGRALPRVRADGKTLRPTVRVRKTSVRIRGEGARSARIVWRGLRVGKKLKRTVAVKLLLKDLRGRTTVLKPRVAVRGRKRR